MADYQRPSGLRSAGQDGAATQGQGLPGAVPINESAELLADLLGATGLLTADKLASARSRAGNGSLVQALVDEGVIPAARVAKALANRYQLPLIELNNEKISPDAANSIPPHVLERVIALPYALKDDRLMVAIADPSNINGIDELRLATR
ncbi:MAG: type pilus assembly protein PilB, partial [Gaiellaceae bacterium]|nr:type pilus assembly protein PilB [Gaiellaceae bacterium]